MAGIGAPAADVPVAKGSASRPDRPRTNRPADAADARKKNLRIGGAASFSLGASKRKGASFPLRGPSLRRARASPNRGKVVPKPTQKAALSSSFYGLARRLYAKLSLAHLATTSPDSPTLAPSTASPGPTSAPGQACRSARAEPARPAPS